MRFYGRFAVAVFAGVLLPGLAPAGGHTAIGVALTGETRSKIIDVSVAAVVFGRGAYGFDRGRVLASRAPADASGDRVMAVARQIVASGVSPGAVRWWLQSTDSTLGHRVNVGIVMVSLGSPAFARGYYSTFEKNMEDLGLHFSINPYVRIDCAALTAQEGAALRSAARHRAELVSAAYGLRAGIVSVTKNAPGAYHPGDEYNPVALCADGRRPSVSTLGGSAGAPLERDDYLTKEVEGTAELRIALPSGWQGLPPVQAAPPGASAQRSSGHFSGPPGAYESPEFQLSDNGKFIGTPGYAQVSAPLDAALLHFVYGPGWTDELVGERVKKLLANGIGAGDILEEPSPPAPNLGVYVRVRPLSDERFNLISTIMATPPSTPRPAEMPVRLSVPAFFGPNTQEYRFIRDCSPYERYALSVAVDRSRGDAQIVAPILLTSLGTPFAQTDRAGARNDVMCGVSAADSTERLVAAAKGTTGLLGYTGPSGTFSESIYIGWSVAGSVVPTIRGRRVGSGSPFSIEGREAHDYAGSYTPVPQAFAMEGWRNSANWSTEIVPAKDGETAADLRATVNVQDGLRRPAVLNVVTDCDQAQHHALAAAVTLAVAGPTPVRWLLAGESSKFANILCLQPDSIGYSGNAVLLYRDDSPTGLPQVTDSVSIFR